MQTKVLPAEGKNAIAHAVDVLAHGGVVVFPTDTVYGLGATVFDEEGIDRLYDIKGRNHSKAIAVLLSDLSELDVVTPKPQDLTLRLAQRYWPGPLTLVIDRHPGVPAALSPGPTIGVRVPDHPIALKLLRATGPLAVTSANLSGGPNANTAQEALEQLGGRVHLILDGGSTPGGVPSTVLDLTVEEPRILRPGPITAEQLLAVLA